jgi:sigma-B regulation protein RsbU (phosphoserine phosphatase)
LTLRPGEALLLYSDGVTDALDATGLEYGRERLQAAAAGAPRDDPNGLLAHVVDDHGRFAGTVLPADDMTLLAIQFRG